VLFGLAAAVFLARDIPKIQQRLKANRQYREVESIAAKHGIRDGREIFTCNFNVYFPSFSWPRPVYNGGWARLATWRYNEIIPELRVDTLEQFLDDCRAYDIRMLLLTEDTRELSPVMHAIYKGEINHRGIRRIAETGRFRIFLVVPRLRDHAAIAEGRAKSESRFYQGEQSICSPLTLDI
jgi:hypothetical protein